MRRFRAILLAAAGLAFISPAARGADPFLQSLYDSLHVFLPWAGITENEIRQQFRTMKRLGFNNLKQLMSTPEWPQDKLMEIALQEGIIPFWYGEAGWQSIDSALLQKLEIPAGLPMDQIRRNPRMVAYQNEFLRHQIPAAAEGMPFLDAPGDGAKSFTHTPDPFLHDADVPYFEKWLRSHYPDAAALARAWNEYEVGISAHPIQSWTDVDRCVEEMSKQPNTLRGYGGEYGRVRDVLRYKAQYHAEAIQRRSLDFHSRFPAVPTRTGGEMGLFLPFAWRATNMQMLANTQLDTGSFYPSIHFAWHFGEVHYEVARPIYMQASFAVDLFKGGWTGGWESTGGPQQLTGSKGGDPWERATTPGYTVDAGVMTQLLLSFLASGFKGAGIWTWNYREAGWEAGEYALLNRQLKPGARAVRAGQIAQAAQRYRDEIWAAHKEPVAGVLLNWDSDAIWAAISLRGRDHFRDYPMKARVGISRALIDGNVPFEYVTVNDLRSGLGPRYKVIYLGGQIALDSELLSLLTTYVRQGGRVVMDSPGGMYDLSGKVFSTATGSPFEQLFGAELADLQYSNNVPQMRLGRLLSGFITEIHPTSARVTAHFDSGEPAVVENTVGNGKAVLLGWDASFELLEPGKSKAEEQLRQVLLGTSIRLPYRCDGAIVYRLSTPKADHYFFINDGGATSALLETPAYVYQDAEDALTGQRLVMGKPIQIEAHSGRWVRFTRR
jgi:beta-galactosidase